jgi:quinol monooxygenase YgiN
MIFPRECTLGLIFLVATTAGSAARAQTGEVTICGVTNLDVAPGATNQAIATLKQYRDAALKQAGNAGVTLLQEVGWPNRFLIYETWNDQSAYDDNEKAAYTAEFRDRLKPIAGALYDRRDYHVITVGPVRTAAGGDTIFMQVHPRTGADLGGRQGGGRGRQEGRGQPALRCRAICQSADGPYDPLCRLAKRQSL